MAADSGESCGTGKTDSRCKPAVRRLKVSAFSLENVFLMESGQARILKVHLVLKKYTVSAGGKQLALMATVCILFLMAL